MNWYRLFPILLSIFGVVWTLYTMITFGPNRTAANTIEAIGMIGIVLLFIGSIAGVVYNISHWNDLDD